MSERDIVFLWIFELENKKYSCGEIMYLATRKNLTSYTLYNSTLSSELELDAKSCLMFLATHTPILPFLVWYNPK